MQRKKGDICKETSKDSNLVVLHILTEDSDDKGRAWAVTLRVGNSVSLDTRSCIDVNQCGWDADRVWLEPERVEVAGALSNPG